MEIFFAFRFSLIIHFQAHFNKPMYVIPIFRLFLFHEDVCRIFHFVFLHVICSRCSQSTGV